MSMHHTTRRAILISHTYSSKQKILQINKLGCLNGIKLARCDSTTNEASDEEMVSSYRESMVLCYNAFTG